MPPPTVIVIAYTSLINLFAQFCSNIQFILLHFVYNFACTLLKNRIKIVMLNAYTESAYEMFSTGVMQKEKKRSVSP